MYILKINDQSFCGRFVEQDLFLITRSKIKCSSYSGIRTFSASWPLQSSVLLASTRRFLPYQTGHIGKGWTQVGIVGWIQVGMAGLDPGRISGLGPGRNGGWTQVGLVGWVQVGVAGWTQVGIADWNQIGIVTGFRYEW